MTDQPSLFDVPPVIARAREGGPGHNARDTSIEAFESVEPKLTGLTATVLGYIAAKPMTCFEIEQEFGLRHQTASSRVSVLAAKGHIIDSGERRLTDSGRKAIVWAVKS